MERLGEDEIFSIFELITNRVDKKSFSKVCKKFLKVASFHFCWLRTKFPDLLYDMLIASQKMVYFECHEPLSNNHMKLIAESCPNVEHLDLSLRENIDPEGKLEFDDVGLCAIAEACDHLVYVYLGGRLHLKDIGIGSLVKSCKNLRELTFVKCVNVTDKSLNMIGAVTRLKRLDLDGCCLITDLGLKYLANGDLKCSLIKLLRNKCDRITDNGSIHLKKLVCLRTLGLSRCGANITDYGIVVLCELPNLEILYLDFLTNITDISLLEIGRKCLKMWVLSLEGCNRITNVGLQSFYGHRTLFRLH